MTRLLGIFLAALLFSTTSHSAQLSVQTNIGTQHWSSEQLLAHPQVQTVSIPADVSYKKPMQYRAVPLKALLGELQPHDHLQAIALDGFAAELPLPVILDNTAAQAWLAVEDPKDPWPALAAGKHSAGPFYLVWLNPEASGIGAEQWPFQIATLRQQTSVAQRYPALVPGEDASAEVERGFVQFQKNCLACHRLNGAGDAQFGPDLNVPHNPTEYLAGDFLKSYIRDPQSLRRWPQGKMPGFDSRAISDEQLNDLIAYLAHMVQHKVQLP
ncbi:Cytochrome C [Pseudomonas marincola]|uniref:Cytochrome C n=1 Tax=Pseudomonas marincola TaxID=437900 RepID=A0A653E983_9PSED|nr:cytochrome c [Pseudomonas marincola]CAE6924224.1 Cytochrome C [Pseudomonas marincola]